MVNCAEPLYWSLKRSSFPLFYISLSIYIDAISIILHTQKEIILCVLLFYEHHTIKRK